MSEIIHEVSDCFLLAFNLLVEKQTGFITAETFITVISFHHDARH